MLDEARAEITFVTGLVARLHASRVAPAAERGARITYPSGEVAIDFVRGEVIDGAALGLDAGFAARPQSRDRLSVSLARFLAAVRGEGRVLADAGDGVRALDLALAVEQAAGG